MAALGKCSICGKATVEKFKPFCSSRCATIDLGRWLGEGYKVPSNETPEEGDEFPSGEKPEDI